ncbi:hypothetical protein AAE021_07780 [Arthrobacter citreus]|uniref:DUF2834 domain-containing protein n=1 Tax=Arthrobacter citreus TaxID=1670 RepID=A0ABZ3A132_9MICC
MGRYDRSKLLSRGAAALILAGVALCALPALWFGINLGDYPTRMHCTPETGYGSGCYELELEIALVFFAVVVLPWAGFSLYLTLRARKGRTWLGRWWPFLGFSLLTVALVAAGAISALNDPYA